MPTLLEYKCPCCGGALEFDSTLQKVKCPFCDTTFEVEALKAKDAQLEKDAPDSFEWDQKAGSEWQEGETGGLRSYVCNSCGGEIVGDAETAATTCPFCGNAVVMTQNLSGMLKPDYVIPFKLDKQAAKDGLKKHLRGKRLLPKIFKDENHIDDIRGIYVPFWLYDASVDANVRYKAEKVEMWSDSNYNYTKTSYYSVLRGGGLSFQNVPADGSAEMPDDLMESIEPFDFSEAVDFQTAYLAGYFADRYNVTEADNIERINARIKSSTENMFKSTVEGYDSVIVENSSIQVKNGKAKYALFPVWLLNTSWKGKQFTFAMNGQTGKFVGNLPIDRGAFWRWWAGIFAASSVAAYLIMLLITHM